MMVMGVMEVMKVMGVVEILLKREIAFSSAQMATPNKAKKKFFEWVNSQDK